MLTQQQQEIFNGLMLGDGSLEKHKNGKNGKLKITRAKKDRNYLEYHSKIFQNFTLK